MLSSPKKAATGSFRGGRLRGKLLDVAIDLLLADDVAQQVEVAIELAVDRQQMAQLAVVDADVGVDQLVAAWICSAMDPSRK